MRYLLIAFAVFVNATIAVAQKSSISFSVSMEHPWDHKFHVVMNCSGFKGDSIDLKMPVWTPGYYQLLDFANNVADFKTNGEAGTTLSWRKLSPNTWRVANRGLLTVSYEVSATRAFVATPFLDSMHAYILPAGIFLYPDQKINHAVSVTIEPAEGWTDVATGLDSIPGKKFSFSAPDYDVLYDSPILVGNLEEFPSFMVRGIPHRFIAYKPGSFDKAKLMDDLRRIVEAAVKIFGDIPYKRYTFIGIGPGNGGIEHLNSTTVSFNVRSELTHQNVLRNYFFLAHEYFHHYNVKRVRPIELGPFDYDKGNRTTMLWVSEGISVYYEYMTVKRAGLCTEEELLEAFRSNMLAYEGKPGRLYQSLEQASYETWSDGPFGRTGDEVNKTISYYDKGPVVGLLLDFKIRQATKNKRSLDDVMRLLYEQYYLKKKRGFTPVEFRKLCELVAGTRLDEIFDYVSTTKEINYKKYLDYGGLDIDTTSKELTGGWSGITTRTRNDSVFVSSVDWNSPARQAGIRQRNVVVQVDGNKPADGAIQNIFASKNPGDKLQLVILKDGQEKNIQLILGKKSEQSFLMKPKETLTPLQREILQSWLQ